MAYFRLTTIMIRIITKPLSHRLLRCSPLFTQISHFSHLFLESKSKQSKPIFRATIIPSIFSQNRLFSNANSDPNSPPSKTIPDSSTVSSPCQNSGPIDASSSIRKPISLWPGMYHSPVTNALWEARSNMFVKLGDNPVQGSSQSQTQLAVKVPAQSRTSIDYNFSSDYTLREQYRNPWNEIRMGKLLEDLDALAGTVAFKVWMGWIGNTGSCVFSFFGFGGYYIHFSFIKKEHSLLLNWHVRHQIIGIWSRIILTQLYFLVLNSGDFIVYLFYYAILTFGNCVTCFLLTLKLIIFYWFCLSNLFAHLWSSIAAMKMA